MPIDFLLDKFEYCPDTGLVLNKRKGKPSATATADGYLKSTITCEGQLYTYLTHRLAWTLHHKKKPEDVIDHKNGIRCCNRIDNLREVTHEVNMNNRSVPLTYREREEIKSIEVRCLDEKWQVVTVMDWGGMFHFAPNNLKQEAVALQNQLRSYLHRGE